jgi:hypothetical protein
LFLSRTATDEPGSASWRTASQGKPLVATLGITDQFGDEYVIKRVKIPTHDPVLPKTHIVAFIDGDGSDCPEFMNELVRPIQENRFDFVIGSRKRGTRELGSLNTQQIFAARLAGWLLRLRYGVNFTDMSPFRAIRSELLCSLPMREETYGWNLEMQTLVAKRRARILEIPVNHRRRRGGVSKVSGTFKGTILATIRIAATFFRVAFSNDRNHSTVAQTS